MFFFFKQKTAYEMRTRDWSSDVCSSDLRWWESRSARSRSNGASHRSTCCWTWRWRTARLCAGAPPSPMTAPMRMASIESVSNIPAGVSMDPFANRMGRGPSASRRSEEHTSELQSLIRNSYAVFCLKKKKRVNHEYYND